MMRWRTAASASTVAHRVAQREDVVAREHVVLASRGYKLGTERVGKRLSFEKSRRCLKGTCQLWRWALSPS